MTAAYTTRTTCRACGAGPLTDLFSLGDQYVSGFFLSPGPVGEYRNVSGRRIEQGEPVYLGKDVEPVKPNRCPIDLVRCPSCTLVQQRHTVPSELLYSRHYWYRSGVTDTMRRALADVVDAAMDRVQLEPGDVVLDIGSNDGTLLRQYPASLGLVRVGVEPAENLTSETNYENRGLVCIRDFWDLEKLVAEGNDAVKDNPIYQRPTTINSPFSAKIVTACGMMYDLEDPAAFVRDVARVLHPDGLFVAQLQCLRQTVALRDVGNFCHEHLEFYTLASLLRLYAEAGLDVERVEENAVNGGSYRLYARRRGEARRDDTVEDFLGAEMDCRLDDAAVLRRFGESLKGVMANLWQTVESLVRAGKSVWVYGASTKGNVILQAAGIDSRLIRYAADRSPEKWDRVMAGSGILIRSEDEFRANRPDFALVLPYTFLDEFTARESAWRSAGGRWIVPIPEVRVV